MIILKISANKFEQEFPRYLRKRIWSTIQPWHTTQHNYDLLSNPSQSYQIHPFPTSLLPTQTDAHWLKENKNHLSTPNKISPLIWLNLLKMQNTINEFSLFISKKYLEIHYILFVGNSINLQNKFILKQLQNPLQL